MTITKVFNFSTDAQGWTATTSDPKVHAFHRLPIRRESGDVPRTYNDIATHGGCLRTTAMGTSANSSNHWSLSTTWAALGVPSWAVVTGIRADYQYRWDMNQREPLTIGAGLNTTGPFQILDAGNAVIGTTSAANVLASSFGGRSRFEVHYPIRTGNPKGAQAAGANRFWQQVAGSTVAIPSSMSKPSSAVKLKLANTIQQITWGGQRNYLRLRQDWITLTITYRRRRVVTS